jgi:hypothetical protein
MQKPRSGKRRLLVPVTGLLMSLLLVFGAGNATQNSVATVVEQVTFKAVAYVVPPPPPPPPPRTPPPQPPRTQQATPPTPSGGGGSTQQGTPPTVSSTPPPQTRVPYRP